VKTIDELNAELVQVSERIEHIHSRLQYADHGAYSQYEARMRALNERSKEIVKEIARAIINDLVKLSREDTQ